MPKATQPQSNDSIQTAIALLRSEYIPDATFIEMLEEYLSQFFTGWQALEKEFYIERRKEIIEYLGTKQSTEVEEAKLSDVVEKAKLAFQTIIDNNEKDVIEVLQLVSSASNDDENMREGVDQETALFSIAKALYEIQTEECCISSKIEMLIQRAALFCTLIDLVPINARLGQVVFTSSIALLNAKRDDLPFLQSIVDKMKGDISPLAPHISDDVEMQLSEEYPTVGRRVAGLVKTIDKLTFEEHPPLQSMKDRYVKAKHQAEFFEGFCGKRTAKAL